MGYEVLARKWRPRQFGDVIGQSHVTQTLKNAIARERVAHAYLFVGPRGVGKTSLTRIFAKALNCASGPTQCSCDACDACREISAGTSLDVLEIDGASNNGVEQVRELRETVRFSPASCRYKIITIDEVHMLSTAAFNALLKTLEEPPAHVVFFFATTEVDKVLPTIISRCQRFDLRRIPVPLIVERLRSIATEESIDIENDALLAIARGAEGGMRDALSALDQLVAFTDARIVEADVLSIFGLISRTTLESLSGHILAGRVPEMLETLHTLDASGKDLRRLVVELLDHFRNLLVARMVGEQAALLDLTSEQLASLRELAGLAEPGRLIRVAEALVDLDGRLRHALSRRVLVETTLIRCARVASTVSIEEILKRVEALRQSLATGPSPAPVPAPPAEEAPPPPSAPAPAAPRTAVLDDPLVQKAIELFNGKVVGVTQAS